MIVYEKSESRSVVSNSLQPQRLYSPWNSPGNNAEVCSCSLLQGVFPTQGPNLGLLHGSWILYQLSHQKFTYPVSNIKHQIHMTGKSCILRVPGSSPSRRFKGTPQDPKSRFFHNNCNKSMKQPCLKTSSIVR